jgi:hypothetical protein
VVEAGRAGAADPSYTVRSQRARLAAGERARTVAVRDEQPGAWEPAEVSSADDDPRPRGGDRPAAPPW